MIIARDRMHYELQSNYSVGMSIYCEYRKKMIQECRNSICEADFNDFDIVTGQELNSYVTKFYDKKIWQEI